MMFKRIGNVVGAVALVASMGFAGTAYAVTAFDQNVTSNVIFGSGNVNGAFTTDRANGVELGLRAKLRFNSSNSPENTFNSNGLGTYNFNTGVPSPGFGFAPNNPQAAKWNFEWSINSNFDGTGGNLNSFTYALEIDGDPTGAVDFGLGGFDVINIPFADHSIGNNSTPQAAGIEATDSASYNTLISNNNLAQNSSNYLFFTPGSSAALLQLALFNPNTPGTYTINLSAFDNVGLLASTSIDVVVSPVPIPAALPLLGSALAFMGFVGRRRRKGSVVTVTA